MLAGRKQPWEKGRQILSRDYLLFLFVYPWRLASFWDGRHTAHTHTKVECRARQSQIPRSAL
jgi:hypothetical protein